MLRYGNGLSSGGFATGLTKREMIAMHIIGGMAADPDIVAGADAVAKISVAWADALMAELDRTAK